MLVWLSGMMCRLAQQMPLPLAISCSSKSRLVLTFLVLPFWYLLTQVVPDKFQKSSKTIVCCVFVCVQLMKRQFGMAGRVPGAVAGASFQSLDLARHIRDKLPIQQREDFLELEAWLTDGDDETIAANRAQLKDHIGRGAFGTVEREYVHSALLRLFAKSFAHWYMSWAGAKGSKEFTLKTSAVWELLNDVINAKFPNFQRNMAVHFNNFHKDVGKLASRAGRRSADCDGHGDGGARCAGNQDEPALPDHTSQPDLFEGSIEGRDGVHSGATSP